MWKLLMDVKIIESSLQSFTQSLIHAIVVVISIAGAQVVQGVFTPLHRPEYQLPLFAFKAIKLCCHIVHMYRSVREGLKNWKCKMAFAISWLSKRILHIVWVFFLKKIWEVFFIKRSIIQEWLLETPVSLYQERKKNLLLWIIKSLV